MIEVNPRVSRSSALASKATGYPIARVAAQIAAGRRLAEIPNVVTGTTVAAFEPALDYVVVKLPRFPFDKFPLADRTLGSQMKATGEVMAIDRTFGAALNKALRGLEQAGVGPLAENPEWPPTLDYLAAVYQAPNDDELPLAGPSTSSTPRRSAGSMPTAKPANRPGSPSARPRRSSCAGSWSRPTRACGGCSPCSAGACPRRRSGAATGIASWFLAEFGRAVALESAVASARAAARATRPTARRCACWRRSSGPASAIVSWPAWPASSRASSGRRRRTVGLRPGYAMVDTCAAEFAAETPYFYATYAAAGSPPEAPPVGRPAALVIGSGPVRIGQGIEFDYCAVQAADTLRRLGWNAVMINSNPETVSTDFDASQPAVLRAARPRDRSLNVIEAETPAGEALLPAFVQFGGQTPLNLAGPLAAAGVPLLGADLEAIDQAEDRTRFAALLDRLGIPQPEGGMARSIEEALTLAERIGYPVIVRPSLRDRRPGHRLRLLAGGPGPAAGRGDGRRSRPAGPDRPLPRGRRSRRRRDQRRRDGPDPGPARARRAGRRPLGRLGRHLPAADRQRGRPGPDRRRPWSGSCWRSACAAWSMPSSSSATTAST